MSKISKESEVSKMSKAGNKGLEKALQGRICGIKDSILGAFEQRDFAQVMRLANLLEANLLESNPPKINSKESSAGDLREDFSWHHNSDSSGNRGGDSSQNCGGDLSEDFINEGAKELGEFVASAIALSALEMAKLTQGKREITKQAVIFAKIAQNAHKTSQESQDKISQNEQSKNAQNDRAQTQNTQNAQNDKGKISQNPQDKIQQNNFSQNEFSQDKMVFYDFTLAKAYAANGDIAQAKELLENLAKPFLDFAPKGAESSTDLGLTKSSAKSSDCSALDSSERGLDFAQNSHIDENIAGGGGGAMIP